MVPERGAPSTNVTVSIIQEFNAKEEELSELKADAARSLTDINFACRKDLIPSLAMVALSGKTYGRRRSIGEQHYLIPRICDVFMVSEHSTPERKRPSRRPDSRMAWRA